MSRVVVFGGSGFLGSAVSAGIHDAVTPPRSVVDLADAASVRRFLRPGDHVINAAGYAVATDRTLEGRGRLQRENVQAVQILAEEAMRAGVAQLIHISSVAAMGHAEGELLTEDQMVEPRSPYGASKRDAERALAAQGDRLPATILRPTSVFGEGRPLAVLLCRIAGLPLVPLPAGGRALIPFTYVGNVVAAVRRSIGCSACLGRTFIVGDEQSYPLREIVEGLATGMGRDRVRIVPVPTAVLRESARLESRLRGDRRAPILDPTRVDTLTRSVSFSIRAFQEATGYEPPFSLSAATQRIGAWYGARSE